MGSCQFKEAGDCQRISTKVDVRYFWGKKIAAGNIENISKSCMCINTKYCFPLDSKIELFILFKRNVLDILARVSRYKHIDSLYDTMCLEVLSSSPEYSDFLDSYSPDS